MKADSHRTLSTNEEAIQVIIEAIEKAGYKPGDDVRIALDVAASEFYDAEKRHLQPDWRRREQNCGRNGRIL